MFGLLGAIPAEVGRWPFGYRPDCERRSDAIWTCPELVSQLGATATGLIVLGGVLYSAGAAVYALRRPDPAPEVFG
jgi:hypothetical protein